MGQGHEVQDPDVPGCDSEDGPSPEHETRNRRYREAIPEPADRDGSANRSPRLLHEVGRPVINATDTDSCQRIAIRLEIELARLFKEDAQLFHILTHHVELADRPKNAAERRGHGIARVLYTWLRREHEDPLAMAEDIASLAALGRTERWKTAIRTWVHIAHTEPDMFHQYATYANFAAD